jgi:glycosyltransferase involved in cell wall biosynthesis
MINVLISSFACGPNWGSEVGMGWNWVINLSNYCQLHVLTEKGFQKDIEKEITKLNVKYTPIFYYIDIGPKGRNLFWKQGSPLFYFYYRKWQENAYKLSKIIIQNQKIHLIHQLNLIGFREPGYLWKHNKILPFIWGPIGGINQIPFNYILHFRLKNLLFYSIKNVINYFQLFFSKKVYKALSAAKVVISESSNTQKVLDKHFNIKTILIHETGCFINSLIDKEKDNDILKIIWIGKIQGTKALPIALKTISNINKTVNCQLTIIGDGPDEKECKMLAKKLGIYNTSCNFVGKIPPNEALRYLRNSDLLFFTSLKEGTSSVVLEALSMGIPVLCHDICGFGDIINENCGIKIPMISYKQSIIDFSEALIKISKDESLLLSLSEGALQERENFTWNKNAYQVFKLYQENIVT